MLAQANAANDRFGSMFVFFFIALLVVAPFGFKKLVPILGAPRRARGTSVGRAPAS